MPRGIYDQAFMIYSWSRFFSSISNNKQSRSFRDTQSNHSSEKDIQLIRAHCGTLYECGLVPKKLRPWCSAFTKCMQKCIMHERKQSRIYNSITHSQIISRLDLQPLRADCLAQALPGQFVHAEGHTCLAMESWWAGCVTGWNHGRTISKKNDPTILNIFDFHHRIRSTFMRDGPFFMESECWFDHIRSPQGPFWKAHDFTQRTARAASAIESRYIGIRFKTDWSCISHLDHSLPYLWSCHVMEEIQNRDLNSRSYLHGKGIFYDLQETLNTCGSQAIVLCWVLDFFVCVEDFHNAIPKWLLQGAGRGAGL